MTYYIIKASNMTLEDTYKLLHMKEHYNSLDEAIKVLQVADPDIIPPGSQVYEVTEMLLGTMDLNVNIIIKPCLRKHP